MGYTRQIILLLFCCWCFSSAEVYQRTKTELSKSTATNNNEFNHLGIQLTCGQIKTFVDGHNIRRQRIAHGTIPGHPPSSDMKFMVWDEELAAKATSWANHGIFGHNPDRSVGSQRWSMIGENVYLSTYRYNVDVTVNPNIQEALDSWFDERLNYNFGPYDLATEKPVGHYTQMVWANSVFVGCGISQTKSPGVTSTLFVCDYGPTGNFIGQVPYRTDYKGYLRCVKGTCNRPYGAYCR